MVEGLVIFDLSSAVVNDLNLLQNKLPQFEFIVLDQNPSEERMLTLINKNNVAGIFSTVEDQRTELYHLLDRLWIKIAAKMSRRQKGQETVFQVRSNQALSETLEKKILSRTTHIEQSMKDEHEKLLKERSLIRFINEVALLETIDELMLFLKKELRRFHQVQSFSLLVQDDIYTFVGPQLKNFKAADDYDWATTPREGNQAVRQIFANSLGRPVAKGLFWQHINGLFVIEYSLLDSKSLSEICEFIDERIQILSMYIERVIHESDASLISRRWERIFNSLRDPILIVDNNYNVVRSNRAFGMIRGKKCFEIFSKQQNPCRGCPMQNSDSHEISTESKNWSVSSWQVSANEKYYIHHYSDLQRSNDLKVQLFQNQKMVAVGDLADNLTHELNNPLTGIRSLARILAIEYAAENQISADLQQIENAANRCLSTIKHFVAFAKNEDHSPEEISLDDIVKATLPVMKTLMRGYKQGLSLSTNQIKLKLNAHLMQQVIFNLVQNACQAMGGEGSIALSTKLVDREVHLIIRDSGSGIPEGIQEKIFKPFFTTKPLGKGTGLGLSMCKTIVERFGGKISIQSSSSVGTTFVVAFPVPELT